MTIRGRPNYGIFYQDMSVAGSRDVAILGTRLIFLTALTGATFASIAGQTIVTGGVVAPAAILNVAIGKTLGDPIPLAINGKINAKQNFEAARLAWAAQPGVTAVLLVDDDREGAGVEADAPASTLAGVLTLQGGAGNLANVSSVNGLLVEASSNDKQKIGLTSQAGISGTIGASQLFTAAANVNGAIVRTLVVSSNAAGDLLVAAAQAPLGSARLTGSTVAALCMLSAAGSFAMPAPRFLPAGWGLYYFGIAGAYAQASWDFL